MKKEEMVKKLGVTDRELQAMKKVKKVADFIIGGELNARQDDQTITQKVKLAGLVNTIYMKVVEEEHLKFLGIEKLQQIIKNHIMVLALTDTEFAEIVDITELANLEIIK